MNYTQSMDRLQFLGLKPEISAPILRQVGVWINSNGPEWTVERLKTLKTWFITRLSGNEFHSDQWIKSKGGIPSGPFRPLFQMKNFNKVMNVFLIYSSFVSKDVTPKQARKFFDSVRKEEGPSIHIPHLKEVAEDYKHLVPRISNIKYSEYPWSPRKRTMGPNGKTVPEGIDSLLNDTRCSRVIDYIDKYEDLYHDSIDDLYLQTLKGQELSSHESHFCVGRISVIQEPGFKARFIANPRRIFQIMLHGLGLQAFGLIRNLPWDCTFNQLSGVEWVQRNLQHGNEVYCVDLSDATNNFPLSLQMKVAKWLGLDTTSMNLFEELARDKWFLPETLSRHLNNTSVLTWSKGQPLGLYPSFPIFGIAHGMLVESIRRSFDLPDDSFRILGDDIVLNNSKLYSEYMRFLDLLQMPVSIEKCIISHKVAEFAGCIITPNKFFSGVKWRQPTAANRLALISSLPRALDLSKKTDFLAFLQRQAPKPFGSNQNAEGVPLKTRCNLFAPWYLYIKEKEGYSDLERSTKASLLYSSEEIKSQLEMQKEPLVRADIEALLPPCCSKDVKEPSRDSHITGGFVLSKLIDHFRFPTISVPDWFLDEWDSDALKEYLLVHAPREYEKKSNFIKLFYNKMYKGNMLWASLSHNRRFQILSEIETMFLQETCNERPQNS